MGRGVWGIDVSKFSIKAVKVEQSGNGLAVTQMGIMPFEGTDTGEPVNLDDQIKITLAEMKVRLKIGSDRCVLSLPGHSTFNRLIKLPPVEDSKLNEVVRYEAQSQIPFPIDEVIWDYQFVDRKYQVGEEKEVILFAIKKDVVEQFLANIAPIGLNVDAIQFGPVALYNFLSVDQDLGGSCIAVDMGADNSDLLVVDGPKFWIRNLPITGNDITKALQKSFNIPFAEAEKLKVKAPQSQQAQKIFNAIQPVMRDLIGEIHRSVGYYKSIAKQVRFEKILLIGNATRVLNFQKFVSQSLQMPAVRLTKLNRIAVGGSLEPTQFNEDLTTVGTAMGLALQGHGMTPNKINLLPPAYLKRRELKKKQPFVVATVVVLYAMVGALWMMSANEVTALQAKKKQADGVIKDVRAQTESQKLLEDSSEKIKDPLVRIDSLWRERDLSLRVMNLIAPNIPDNKTAAARDRMWVLEWAFQEVPKGPPLPGRIYNPDRKFRIKMDVAVEHEGRDDESLVTMIFKNLLLVTRSGDKYVPISGKKSVVSEFKLVRHDTAERRFQIDRPVKTGLLLPKSALVNRPAGEDTGLPRFVIFDLVLEFPIREEKPVEAPKESGK